jgi:hypothetical protein
MPTDKTMNQTAKQRSEANLGFGQKPWAAVDKLHGHVDAAEYKHVVLGLIFLKYNSKNSCTKPCTHPFFNFFMAVPLRIAATVAGRRRSPPAAFGSSSSQTLPKSRWQLRPSA